ncbi:protoporphyrinogen oxidase [Rhodococcus triatomae]|uniref:Oxygen-dependent protoporphyrinogen oxidase n=1 Tax=Rhodococcus triatomae TaxID=300028 RepID=A0A1G8KNS5_9NOCA|nr:protoporphyrinogen oxidase [Rhodococcus triatomae]QNG18981.1 protoporphyrinogen oxidase [Rhodococcus triatomae]QNG25106.1 protoporphyrinogen oxidase [Rhodococcus triatomae]SDI45084.1 oxygen-dependent protoporphyrinogen oxidase [Rhodococcus triatomae]
MTTVAVVGGGIAGLVAAYRLRRRLGASADIVVIESSGRVGGKLRTVDLAGGPVDVGAEAFIARRPEVRDLVDELGLSEQLVHPAGASPLIWSQGGPVPMPRHTLMGIPADGESLVGLVDDATLARIAREETEPLDWVPGSDRSVADLVGSRFGDQVVARSVDPLLGGVYSGLSDSIGVRAALPTLAVALDGGARSLTAAVRQALPAPSSTPVFGTLRDGYGVLLEELVAATGARLVTDEAGRVRRDGGGWSVEPVGHVDGVVLAVPARQLATLLDDVAPEAAAAAAAIPLASSVVVALALPADARVPDNSGILVATDSPLGPGATAKAFTLSSRKWPHLARRDVTLVRASYGRFGDSAVVDDSDEALVASAIRDFAVVSGTRPEPVASFVQRWHEGLPQYGPGHDEKVGAVEAAVAELDGLEVAGAWMHGVGVPACVASATTATTRLLAQVAR